MNNNILKTSLISAIYQFRNELKDLNVPQNLRDRYIREFSEAFKRSDDYDLAASSVFEQIMSGASKSQTPFKVFWKQFSKDAKKDEMMQEIETRADELASRELRPGIDWKEGIKRIAKILVVEFGLAIVAAFAIAIRASNKK